MHAYSTDNDLRPKIIGGIGALALFVLIGFDRVAATLGNVGLIGVTWAILFGIGFTLFDHYLWKAPIMQKTPLVSTPDLSGEWEGWIETSYNGDYEIPEKSLHPNNDPDSNYTRITGSLYITQCWRKMNIHFATYTSTSDSVGATILSSDGRWPTLSYQYENQPDSDTPDTMSLHYGTTNLELKEDKNGNDILEGFYYTGNGRRNHGKMYFKRVD